MKLLIAGSSLAVALASGTSPIRPSDPAAAAEEQSAHTCEAPNLDEVPAGEFDPLSVPQEDGIVWYGTWEGAMAEKERTGKPILLHFGSPRRPTKQVCVPGAW